MQSFSEWRDDDLKKNKEGGYEPAPDEKQKWKKVDLITLPPDVKGTNCGNCRYITDRDNKHYCTHKKVETYITPRMCCAFWDNKKVKRSWE